MDEYLSEKEQIQRIRDWWNDNGWYLIGGVVLGVIGIFGYGRYQDYVAANAEAAGALYRQLETAAGDDDLGEVERLLGVLRAEHEGSAYTDQAALLTARLLLIRDTDRAAAELRRVMQESRDNELAMIARLRLARVLAYQEQYDEALALLNVESPGPFSARISEVRGDIHLERGDRDAARAAFTAALVAEGSELLDRNFVQMKLQDLLGDVASAGATMPLEAPAAVDETPADGAPAAGESADEALGDGSTPDEPVGDSATDPPTQSEDQG